MSENIRNGIGGQVAGGSLLFGDFVQKRYLPFVRENKRSWKTDERYLSAHVLPYLSALPLAEVNAEALENWLDTLEITGLSPSSCYRIFWLVKYILNCAVRWHVLPDDSAFKNAVCTRKQKRRPETLSSKEALALIRLLEEYSDRPSARAIHLLLLTGAGKSEILNARWEDVDLKRGTLLTTRTYTGRSRLIPLSNEAVKLIRRLPRREHVPWLFSSPSGKRLVSLFYTWDLLRRKIGRPELRLADLRHSFAGFLINMGIQRSELVAIMGHYMPGTLEIVKQHHHTESL
ncbi:site-specific integrase [Mailhella massiliensis]|uniref:Site-specific integrase n=1 Tax=Mailhella massiliensis TaxID=1903261 RepID=A0A921AYY5_9BACT|nr:site-specific integrase [Mailhella massiliensis]HJD98347.1 site-specific integrase [Mailhella massiliensis]